MEKESTRVTHAYETLDPLGVSGEADVDASSSYSVFRREITASTCQAVDIPASDNFSLDVFGDSPSRDPDDSRPLRPALTSRTPSSPEALPFASSDSAWFRAGSRFRSTMLQLHKEILDFSEILSPTTEEQAKRTAAVNSVFEVVKYIWPHSRFEVFGSFETGLYLPTSDIDVVILDSKLKTPQTGLYALARALSQKGIAKKMQGWHLLRL